jgi:hypothetical protein
MNLSGSSASAASPVMPGIFLSGANVKDSATTKGKDVGRQISTEEGPSGISLTGVVDAIREVGRQRKSVLDQARSALQSGDNDEALRCLHQLCGLAA